MAEDALFSIAGELVKILGSLVAQEVALYWGAKDQLCKLESTVTKIKAVLLDAEEQAQKQNNQVKVWLGDLREVVFDAEDLLDDFSTQLQRKQLMSGGRVSKEVRIFFSGSNQFVYGCRMGHKVRELRERLNEIDADRKQFNFKVRDEERASLIMFRGQTTSAEPEVVIGREDDKKVVKCLLLNSNYRETVSVISIVGMGGLGKTTLAQLVFNDEQVKSHFDLKHWESVSGCLDVEKIVKDMLEAVGGDRNSDQLEILKNHLQEKIKNRKFLFVLDDVWGDMNGQDGEKWDILKQLLACGSSGSKIIITTRSKQIADFTSTRSHVLQGLSNDDSWNLFKGRAFHQAEESSETDNEKIKDEVVKRCCGVPLVIKAIGRLMCQKDRCQWLSFVINELPSRVQDDNIINTLGLSYDPLPSHMKHCFAYCRLFPKGQEIDVNSLVQLWIAQGFISPSNPNEALEVAGLRCFEDLLWRSFFHEVDKDGLGNIVSCKMHDFMHDLAAKVSGSESLKVDREGTTVSDLRRIRHVSFDMELDLSQQLPIPLVSAKILRTLMLLRAWQYKSYDAAWDSNCLEKYRRLRVLHLHDLEIEKLSPVIGKLKHLRYLDLSGNGKMKTLPNSITNLVNLQVLKLNVCVTLKALPRDIKKLINLRDIELDSCISLENMPREIGQLTSLQTLSRFVVDTKDSSKSKHIGGLDELKRLNELKGCLRIVIRGCVRNSCISEFKEAELSKKQFLQELVIDWDGYLDVDIDLYGEMLESQSYLDVDDDLYDEMLQSLRPHPNLQSISLYCYRGMRFPSWLSNLTNLKEITFYNCERCKHIPPLHEIPTLEKLRFGYLRDLEYIDSEGEGGREVSTFFPSLKTLRIWSCPKLKGWWKKGITSDDDHRVSSSRTPAAIEGGEELMINYFPRLSRLSIENCPNLTSMPLFPSLDDGLVLWYTSSVPLQQTMKMTASAWKSPESSSPFNQPSLSKLKRIDITGIEDMESLPGVQNLSSLQELSIEDCPRLKSLPLSQKTHPCLEKFSIRNCQRLSDSIFRDGQKAVEWPNVAYIPNIRIQGRDIQRDGRYVYEHEEELLLLDYKLQLRKTNSVPLQQTLRMIAWKSPSVASSSPFVRPLSKLKHLVVDIEDLESLPTEDLSFLQGIQIWNCERLESLPLSQEMHSKTGVSASFSGDAFTSAY